MIGSVKYKKLSCSKSIISFFISVAALAAVVLTVLPVASAAPSRIKSSLPEPVPSVVDNGDGTKTYVFYLLIFDPDYSSSTLFESSITTSSTNILLYRLAQQRTNILSKQNTGSFVGNSYNVVTGASSAFVGLIRDASGYNAYSGYDYYFSYRAGYFVKNSAFASNKFVHVWLPDGMQLVNETSAYTVEDWVDWSVNPAENVFYSHLDRPVQDQWNRFFIAYNRKTKEGVLIHFNVSLNGIFQAMFDGAVSYASSNVSGDGYYTIPAYAIDLEGFYDSTGQYYQGAISPNQSGDVDITFSLPASTGSISAELSELVDGNSFSPMVDFSSGSETYKLYQPNLIYNNFGSQSVHYNVSVGIYNLLDGTLNNQYVFDSVLGNSNAVTLDIGTPITDINSTHIIDFGCLYNPNLSSGFNWGSVQWSVDPVVIQWRSDVISNIQQIRDLLQQQIGEDATQLNQSAVDSFHQAEDALQVKDGNGQPIDIAAQAEHEFDNAIDSVNSLAGSGGALQFLNSAISNVFSEPLLVLPVVVALALGVAITILGKNKSE